MSIWGHMRKSSVDVIKCGPWMLCSLNMDVIIWLGVKAPGWEAQAQLELKNTK